MSILVVESGGTKTDWALFDRQNAIKEIQTVGFNPSLTRKAEMIRALDTEIRPWLGGTKPEALHFFGAGLGRPIGQIEMRNLLKEHLVLTCPIHVQSDLMGAAYACLGTEPGVVGILGTGSAAFRYEHQSIFSRRGGWGYLLGDEGAGSDLGRTLIRRILEKELPEPLCAAYETFSGKDTGDLLSQLYSAEMPVHFLARQVPFLAEHQHEPSIRQILTERIELFLKTYLLPMVRSPVEKVVLCGGVARIFSDLVESLCREHGLINAFILKESPIRAIVRFLTQPQVPTSERDTLEI